MTSPCDASGHRDLSAAHAAVRVLLADDQALLRRGFRLVLESEPDIEVVGEAADGDQAVRQAQRLRPDVVLLDIRMPVMDGLTATKQLSALVPDTRVLLLTTFDLDEYVHRGLRAGAVGFLLKDCPPEQLVDAVRAVAAGDAVLAPRVTRRLVDTLVPLLPDPEQASRRQAVLAALTPREVEVLLHIATGASNRDIAAALHLAEGTVKVHVSRILTKLQLSDRVQAAVLAHEAGLVPGRSV